MDDNDGDDDENNDGEEENSEEDADADYSYFAGCDPLQLSSSRCLCSFLQQRGSLLCV